ncbi:hypothetical protein CPB83DRAFT_887957 [Crepidotus variabilis]|uniref:Uncharacterized protein n=1 Tax=Crepidotus variabilis TaxID=179855 RepID=A0A9P6BD59_9AGAR|nr:hypothetical protein CPB83DRAFT_887957 [Crepidotus variabilis]
MVIISPISSLKSADLVPGGVQLCERDLRRKIPTVIAGDMRCALTKSAVHQVIAFIRLQNASKPTSTQIGGKSRKLKIDLVWLLNELLLNLNLVWDEIPLVTYTLAVPTSLILSWSTWCNARMLEVPVVQELGGNSEISAHNKMYALRTI